MATHTPIPTPEPAPVLDTIQDGLPRFVSVGEYLRTSYRPDCDFVDGEVQERNLGEIPHGGLQDLFSSIFRSNRMSWNLRTIPEQRLQVSSQRFRIPDVMVLRPEDTREPVVRVAPVACIEILSRKDTVERTQERVDDYLSLGVRAIWIIDPRSRRAWTADAEGFHRVAAELTLPEYGVTIPLQILWDELDDLAAGR